MADGILNPIPQLEADIDFDVYTKQEVDALLDEKADKDDTYTKTETDALLNDKADADSVYTKTETDNLLSAKADADSVYTKTETDGLLSAKADANNVYTKVETDNLLNDKADKSTTYTKTETDTLLNGKANVSTTLTGYGITDAYTKTETDTLLGAKANADDVYTKTEIDNELTVTKDGSWVKTAQSTATNLEKLESGLEYAYAVLSKQYDQLKKYVNGNYYDFDSDIDAKYVKNIPANAMPYADLQKIGGKTLVWNQLEPNPTTVYSANASHAFNIGTQIISGHKYYMSCTASGTLDAYTGATVYARIGSTNVGIISADNPHGYASIVTSNNNATSDGTTSVVDGNCWIYVYLDGATSITNITLIDLTLMFGSGNEPTTVAEFQQMFPASYYAYDSGSLLSAGVTEVVSVGKNIADYSGGQGYPSNTAYANTTKRTFEIGKYVVGLTSNNYYNPNQVTAHSVSNNTVTVTSNAKAYGVAIPFPCQGGGKYTVSLTLTNAEYSMGWYAQDGSWISNGSALSVSPNTFIAPANAVCGFLSLQVATNGVQGTISNIQIEQGETATSYSAPFTDTLPIPASVQALEGYGWSAGSVYNYVDFERKKFVQNVGRVDLGSLSWQNSSTAGHEMFYTSVSGLKTVSANSEKSNIICPAYLTDAYNNVYNHVTDKTTGTRAGATNVYVYDASALASLTKEQFKTAMDGVYLYYELTTPIETDISAYLDDNTISVESGGTLTFPNSNGDDYRIDVPSEEEYLIDLSV